MRGATRLGPRAPIAEMTENVNGKTAWDRLRVQIGETAIFPVDDVDKSPA